MSNSKEEYDELLQSYHEQLVSRYAGIDELEKLLKLEQDDYNRLKNSNPNLASTVASAACMVMQMIIRIKSDKIIKKYCE